MATNGKSKKNKKKIFIFSGIGVVVIALILVVVLGSKKENVITVQTEKASKRTITQIVTASGKIQPETMVKINAEVSGEITQLPVKEGDRVRKGQLLMQLWNDDQQAEQAFSQAQLETSRKRVVEACTMAEQARRELARQEGLFKQGFVSEGRLDTVRAEADTRTATCATAKADVAQSQARVAVVGAATSQIAYTASKGGVLAMTREIAVEYARRGIRANALCPGPVRTPLLDQLLADPAARARRIVHIPMGRLAEADEIAVVVHDVGNEDSLVGSEVQSA